MVWLKVLTTSLTVGYSTERSESVFHLFRGDIRGKTCSSSQEYQCQTLKVNDATEVFSYTPLITTALLIDLLCTRTGIEDRPSRRALLSEEDAMVLRQEILTRGATVMMGFFGRICGKF